MSEWTEAQRLELLARLRELPVGAPLHWNKLSEGLDRTGPSARAFARRTLELNLELQRISGGVGLPTNYEAGIDRVIFTREVIPDVPVTDLWAAAEALNEVEVKKALTQARLGVDLGTGWKLICFASDQHTCVGEAVDLKRMREDAELIRDTPGAYVILVGDGVDNHIKHAAAALHAKSTPGTQYKLFDHYLGILGDKTLAMVTGNHDQWSDDIAGLDMMKFLADKNGIVCTKDEAIVTVTLGDVEYVIAARHQYRMNSQFNQGHAVKRWWEMGDNDFDIGCLAHHHQAHFENFIKHDIERYAFRPGSYQIASAYSRRYGFSPSTPTCPCVVIGEQTRDITPFSDLRKGVRYLKALRCGDVD